MFGIRNGIAQQAFCSGCRRPWEQCLRQCNRQAQPVNSNGRSLRLLNPQARSAAWRYRGQPTAVFCNGCGGPYHSTCCNGAFGPINALGELLTLSALDSFMGDSALLNVVVAGELLGCGLCYGACTCLAGTSGLLDALVIAEIIDEIGDASDEAEQQTFDGDYNAGQGEADPGYGDSSQQDVSQPDPVSVDPAPSYDPPADFGGNSDFGGGGDFGGGW